MSGRVWGVWEEGGGRCKRNEIRERERERNKEKRQKKERGKMRKRARESL